MSRAALFCLVLGGTVIVLLPFVWHALQRDPPTVPAARTLEDVVLHWKCDAGHTFDAPGHVDPVFCKKCNNHAYPVTGYHCARHGRFQVQVKFQRAADGTVTTSAVRLLGRDWASESDGVYCPNCERRLTYEPADPFGSP